MTTPPDPSLATASAPTDIDILLSTPTLRAYVNRNGAEPRHFRRYVKTAETNGRDDGDGYNQTRELAVIKLDQDGNIKATGDLEQPSDDERKKIKEEVALAKWPEHTTLDAIGSLPDALKDVDDAALFEFRDTSNRIVMLQQRVEGDNKKRYVPWTWWSDGKWRQMEPDGKLPLWGLEQLKTRDTVFIHEGAKAARYVRWMIDAATPEAKEALAAHPWATRLENTAHIGWIGGAPNSHRTDWGPIKRLGRNARIYVVADNDDAGVNAVPKISRMLKRRMEMIRFDREFDHAFDLADPWPSSFWKSELYTGPSLEDHTFPATWATDQIPNPKGKPTPVLRSEFAAEWVCVEKPPVFIHNKRPDRKLTAEEFAFQVSSFSDTRNIARLLEKQESSKVQTICYKPYRADATKERRTQVAGNMAFNIFRPSRVHPNKKGDATPFLDYMTYLIPDEVERHETLKWIATLVARPDIRMEYALLLISEKQGVGKTTLGSSILAPLVGEWNCSWPNEEMIVGSPFNSWIANKRLAIINEIYSGTSRKAYDKLKSVITDREVEVHEKYLSTYKTENVTHVFACSNSIIALHLDMDDRRWFAPRVTEELHPEGKQYWGRFNTWLNGGGLASIAHWADMFVKEHVPVETGDRAPSTSRKEEIIDESMSEGLKIVRDLVEQINALSKIDPNRKIVMSVQNVREYVAKVRALEPTDTRLEKSLALRKAMLRLGLKGHKNADGRWLRVKIGSRPEYLVANFNVPMDASYGTITASKWFNLPETLMAEPLPGDSEPPM